ncbi:MAG: molybdate ABC transporter substrate-binding protein [Pseudohongiellaceae bacterium]
MNGLCRTMQLLAGKIATLMISLILAAQAQAEDFTIAAASDLRYALDEIIQAYRVEHPEHEPTVIYGSSGQFFTQINNGAPFDLYFSADIEYPEQLKAAGLTASEPSVYAIGRIVLWSAGMDASTLRLRDLTRDDIRRIAIAQPEHAPYGQRAMEAMQAAGVWDAVQSKLVFGENISQAAQMAESGAADVGIIALSLALFPTMSTRGYYLIDADLHAPLTQAYVVTRHGEGKAAVLDFARYMEGDAAHGIMQRFGLVISE